MYIYLYSSETLQDNEMEDVLLAGHVDVFEMLSMANNWCYRHWI